MKARAKDYIPINQNLASDPVDRTHNFLQMLTC